MNVPKFETELEAAFWIAQNVGPADVLWTINAAPWVGACAVFASRANGRAGVWDNRPGYPLVESLAEARVLTGQMTCIHCRTTLDDHR